MKLTYRNKLFFWVIILVWSIFGGLFYFQYATEVNYKKRLLRNELKMIDQHIMSVYEDGHDVKEFVQMLGICYQNSTFDAMQISIYGNGDSLIASVRQPIPPDLDNLEDLQPEDKTTRLVKYNADGNTDLFYFSSGTSRDGKITVKTGMPYSFSINSAIRTDIHWWLLFLITAVASAVVYFSTHLLSRNIYLLRQFAHQASHKQPIDNVPNFPNDELGEIAKEIFCIYTSLIQSIDETNVEHQKVIHALEEKEAFQRRMTNNINHEIKTPLGIIRGYTETILNAPDMDEITRDTFMKRIIENVDRLNSLVSDISVIARLEEKPDSIAISNVNLYDIISGIADDLKFAGIARNMTFIYDIPEDCQIQGNRELLTSVMLNLIRNSILHSNGTEMTLRLIEETPDYYVFSYADNGVGVKQEQLEHLFERFYRADAGRTRKKGGVGLGLSIVHSAVEVLGGTVSARNREEGGLEFTFSLLKVAP